MQRSKSSGVDRPDDLIGALPAFPFLRSAARAIGLRLPRFTWTLRGGRGYVSEKVTHGRLAVTGAGYPATVIQK
jgi:hypothetical protein